MSSNYKLAVIITNPANEDEVLIIKQTRPPKFGIEEYDSYVDSDLWDLPSAQLNPSQVESQIEVQGAEFCADKLNLSQFDLISALNQVSEQVAIEKLVDRQWRFWKYAEGVDFGPGPRIHTVFITGQCSVTYGSTEVPWQWTSRAKCLKWLSEVKQYSDRVGPLVVSGLLDGSEHSFKLDVLQNLHYQEYPLGVMLVPMGSRTAKPFSTTNLVVIAPNMVANSQSDKGIIAQGDALIVDPGCRSRFHKELKDIIAALPRKLIVFVTHHHCDHVDGLSVVQKCNPDAVLLAHENTVRRICKDDWSLGYTSVTGGEEIYVGGQQLRVIFAPGHTDGHMALLHVNTNSLIVGDHCVGQGSASLDINSGGNMAEYFKTTYKFLELAPHALIPMHGRVNLWPKHMLCGYLKYELLLMIFCFDMDINHLPLVNKLALSTIETVFYQLYGDVCHIFIFVLFLRLLLNTVLYMTPVGKCLNRLLDDLISGIAERENSVLKAIENGKKTLFDLVSTLYQNVDRIFCFPASSNVRLHVEHLAQQHQLPEAFSLSKFQGTCRLHFVIRWIWAYTKHMVSSKLMKSGRLKVFIIPVVVACFAALHCSGTSRRSKTKLLPLIIKDIWCKGLNVFCSKICTSTS